MQLQKIVVGVDGSTESLAAARLAARLAEATGAEGRLVHAIPEFRLPGDVMAVALGGRMPLQHIRAQAHRTMRAALRNMVPDEWLESMIVESGAAPVVLRDAAHRCEADLVVLGAKRRPAVVRNLAGSVVPYLLRTLDAPVLLATSDELPSRVLVAVDLSDATPPVLGWGAGLADLLDGEVEALYVSEPISVPAGLPLEVSVEAVRDEAERRFHEVLTEQGIPATVESRVRRGAAADEIAAEAAEWHANLIVVGSQGKGWADRLVIGSTSERLANTLPASLLVLPVASVMGAALSEA